MDAKKNKQQHYNNQKDDEKEKENEEGFGMSECDQGFASPVVASIPSRFQKK